MDDINIKIALIAAGSALIGALIPTLIGYITTRQQNKFELSQDLLQKQKEVYWELIESLQDIINVTQNEQFLNLQKSVLKVSMYGDNVTALALNKYFNELIQSAQGVRTLLSNEEHVKHQTQIINGIRNNFGLAAFDNYEIVGFNPSKSKH